MTTVDLAHQELLIGGSWTGAKSGREYEQRFPYTGDQVGWAAAAGREDAQAAADAAGAAFPEWSRSAPAMRRQILNKAADLLMERQAEIAGSSPRRPVACSAGECSTSSSRPECCAKRRRRRTA
jgi:hypothetical protein